MGNSIDNYMNYADFFLKWKSDIHNSQSKTGIGKLLSAEGKKTTGGLNLSHSASNTLFSLQSTFLTYFFYVLTYKVFVMVFATAT